MLERASLDLKKEEISKMDINAIRYIFILNSLSMAVVGLLINYVELHLPAWLKRTYRFGKFKSTNYSITAKLEVPKKWFQHFYIFAGPASTVVLFLVFYKYLFNGTLPEIILTALDTSLSTLRKPLVPAENVILVAVIFNIHCWKRVYETCYINIFSDQKMHLVHYLLGFIHYIGTLVCIIGEAEGFVGDTYAHFSWDKLLSAKLICALIFLWFSYIQFKTNVILRNLRKSERSDVVSYAYKVPFDGLYKYISAPLQFTEIVMYLMLSMILWHASTFHYVTMWVIINQMECALLSHRWYQETFKKYPKERKVLIPYIW